MSQANRRSHPRQLRRVQVRIQRQGEDRVQHGFTKNLSLSGALISLPDPPGRGSRLRLELVGKEASPVIYGEVVHAHRVPPELRRFAESAMGVRFLDTGELVAPFLPAGSLRTDPGPGTGSQAGGPAPSDGGSTSGALGEAGGEGPELATPAPSSTRRVAGPPGGGGPASTSEPDRSAGAGAASSQGGPPPAPPSPAPPSTEPAGATFTVAFERPSDLLATYRRDLVNGGLFVPTSRPGGLYQTVTVALHLPEPVRRTLQVQARVVQVVEPRTVAGGRTAGGVGLEILDPDRLLAELRPLVERLKGSG